MEWRREAGMMLNYKYNVRTTELGAGKGCEDEIT